VGTACPRRYERRFARRRAGGFRLEVHDAGPGVPAAERGRIFEKFRKGRAATGGAGLGLAFCKLAVERHGGTIGVRDGEKGKGAVFFFELKARS